MDKIIYAVIPTSGVAAATLLEVATPDPAVSTALEILNAAKPITTDGYVNRNR